MPAASGRVKVGKRGRPRKAGQRHKCGKLAQAWDYGNERVQAIRARFAVFQGGKASNELGCCIGRAWAAGLLEGFGVDSQALRDAGRDYARLWFRTYGGTNIRTSNLERQAKSTGIGAVTAEERHFARMDEVVRSMHLNKRDAFYALCIDYFDSDGTPPFIERLINDRLKLAKKQHGTLPVRGDRERLESAVDVLLAIVDGKEQQRRTA